MRNSPAHAPLLNNALRNNTLQLAVDLVHQSWNQFHPQPALGIVLGSGLSNFTRCLDIQARISVNSLPGCVTPTAMGHAGEIICGTLHGLPIVVISGRVHLYEGHSYLQVTWSVRLLHALGARKLLITCAAGGLNPRLRAGEPMLITDTLDLLHARTSAASDASEQQPLATGMATPQPDLQLLADFELAALEARIPLARGIYAAVTGPNYETRAEQRFLRMFADAVGMSTIPELQAASSLQLPAAAIALITNVCNPDRPCITSGTGVLQSAAESLPMFTRLIQQYVATLAAD